MNKPIEDMVRERVLEAIELEFREVGEYKKIMESIGEVQQVHSQFKSGRRYPTFRTIVMLNEVYGYSVDWLIRGKAPRKLKEKDPFKMLDDLEKQIHDLRARFKAQQ